MYFDSFEIASGDFKDLIPEIHLEFLGARSTTVKISPKGNFHGV